MTSSARPTDPSPASATVSAPANIAFIKYWGARDLTRVIPWHPSISMTLEVCRSHSTVEVRPDLPADRVLYLDDDGTARDPGPAFTARVTAHLDRLRAWAGREERFRVLTRNTFPAAAGLASSASGFAALTAATVAVLGRSPGPEELSDLARRSGSGSATRSVMGGYVEWSDEGATETENDQTSCPAHQLHPASHWDLRDVIALVETGPKPVTSLDGHRLATTSPHFERRRELLPGRLEAVRAALVARDLEALGPILEEDAIELHTIAMTSRPAIFYWHGATVEVLRAVRELRDEGLSAWSTMDAGANVHVITRPEHEARVAEALEAVAGVRSVIRDRVGEGPRPEPALEVVEAP